MDVEETIQFLLEQEAVFASRMDELAINLVAIGKAQVRYNQQQAEIQKLQVGHEERIVRLENGLESLSTKLDRLIETGFSINGGRPQ